MRRPLRIVRLLTIALVALGLATTSIAGQEAFKVIVNPDNPVDAVDREFLRDAYLGKATEWSDGETIRPIDLSSKFPVRDEFAKSVLHKTPSQLRTYWNQQIFSGKGVPPPEADSTDDVVDYVVANRGAVGYLPANADPGKAKVIGLR